MTPPVVTVTCPSCGGRVTDAELGERTACKYCGTELHLPTVDYEPADEPIRADAPEHRTIYVRRSSPGAVIFTLLLIVLACGLTYWLLRRPTTVEFEGSGPPPSSPRSPELAGADCFASCTKACTQIESSELLTKCVDSCEKRCKYVGRGTAAECRARCDSTCSGSPNPVSLGACKSSCVSGCPPN